MQGVSGKATTAGSVFGGAASWLIGANNGECEM